MPIQRTIPIMNFRPRFSIRFLLGIVAVVAVGLGWWQLTHPRGLAGTWKGLQRFQNYTFKFDGEQLHISNNQGDVSSPYRLSKLPDNTLAIDVNGEFGLQQGIYRIEGDTLTMLIANPGKKRPDDLGAFDTISKVGSTSAFT